MLAIKSVSNNFHASWETAVHERDENLTIYLDTTSVKNNFWGSSLYSYSNDQPTVVVRGLGLANWLTTNFHVDDYIIVKIDIEGAEYGGTPPSPQLEPSRFAKSNVNSSCP